MELRWDRGSRPLLEWGNAALAPASMDPVRPEPPSNRYQPALLWKKSRIAAVSASPVGCLRRSRSTTKLPGRWIWSIRSVRTLAWGKERLVSEKEINAFINLCPCGLIDHNHQQWNEWNHLLIKKSNLTNSYRLISTASLQEITWDMKNGWNGSP